MEEKITQVQKRNLISLASISEQLNIKEGDYVSMSVSNGVLTITPVGWHDKSQEYFWTEEWQSKMKESVKDLQEGRFQTFDSLEDVAKLAKSLEGQSGE